MCINFKIQDELKRHESDSKNAVFDSKKTSEVYQ